jgi:choline dehydrogenase-like flavoprotein
LPSLPDGKFLPPMALNVVEQHVREAISQKWPDRRLTIGRTANLTEPKEGRAPCQYRSICARGCSYGAYFSTQSSTLPAANATGRLTVVTDSLVEAVDYDPATKKATGVRVINVKTGQRSSHSARMVFLNASAFNSVHILLRSRSEAFPNGLANSSGVLGTHIMDHASTLSTMAMMPGFEDRTTFGNRPTGVVIPRFRNLDSKDGDFTRGYSFQGGALQSGWTAAKRSAGIGKYFKHESRQVGAWRMVFVGFAESLPRATNRLTLDPVKLDPQGLPMLNIHFEHGDNERRALADAKAEAAAMMEAAGGHVVMGFDQPNPGGTAIHEMGGARMGHDPRTSVLNRWSQSHDIANLFVTDGAQMSSSACQNPSLTYMALTARACDHAVSLLKEGAL